MHLSIKCISESTSCQYMLYTRGTCKPKLVHCKFQFGPPVSNGTKYILKKSQSKENSGKRLLKCAKSILGISQRPKKNPYFCINYYINRLFCQSFFIIRYKCSLNMQVPQLLIIFHNISQRHFGSSYHFAS